MAVELIDDYTVRFVLPVPFAPFLRAMGTAIYPKHILEQAVSDGVFAETWGLDTDPAEIIGTGPFIMESYEPGQRVVLRRNPDYWLTDGEGEQLPYLDSLVHIIVPDIEAALQPSGQGKPMYWVRGGITRGLSVRAGGELHDSPAGSGFGTTFLTFNQNPGMNPETGEPYVAPEKLAWFQNAEFRRAVSHAINRDVIIEEAFDGLGYPQWSPISPSAGDFHNPEVRRYEYDPAAAMAMLDDLGWMDQDGDGFREDADGNAITFTIVTNEENSIRTEVLALIREDLHAIGIDARAAARPFGEMVGQLTTSLRLEAIKIGCYRQVRAARRGSHVAQQRGRSTCGPRISPSRRRSGKRRSTACTSRGARSWTRSGECSTTIARKRSRARTFR